MRSLFLTAFLASALLPMGCNLYFNGGDGDPPCDEWGGSDRTNTGVPDQAPLLLRNPETGVCEDFSWGGGPYPCNSTCGPCAGSTEPTTTTPPGTDGDSGGDDEIAPTPTLDPVPLPTWGQCDSYCTGLDEGLCLGTDGCRGIYGQAADGAPGEFLECWATDQSPSGIVDCEGLDAYSCSTSAACIAVHEYACDDLGGPTPDGFREPDCVPGYFLSCHNEAGAGCYGNQDCEEGESCNAADICLSPPSQGDAAPTVCYGFCVPDVDPGECDGDVFCDALPPLCEAGSTPGIANGCWTGECIDLSLCTNADCGDIVGESMCIARDDCSAYYVGGDCFCDANGCTCDEWVFDSCGTEAP